MEPDALAVHGGIGVLELARRRSDADPAVGLLAPSGRVDADRAARAAEEEDVQALVMEARERAELVCAVDDAKRLAQRRLDLRPRVAERGARDRVLRDDERTCGGHEREPDCEEGHEKDEAAAAHDRLLQRAA